MWGKEVERAYLRIAARIKVLGSHNQISRELPVGRKDGDLPRDGSGGLGVVARDHAEKGRENREAKSG